MVVGSILAIALVATASVWAAASSATAKTVNVTLKEFTLKATAAKAPAGKVTFVVKNAGQLEHEFVLVRTTKAPGALPLKGQKASFPSSSELAELEHIQPGQTKRVTVTLKASKYVLLCNLPGHYQAGQRAGFRVG